MNQAVQSFANQASPNCEVKPISGFGAELTPDTCDVLEPKALENERGIVAEISPLTFYCKKCHKVHQYRDVADYRRNTKCRVCKTVELTQMRQIYYLIAIKKQLSHVLIISIVRCLNSFVWKL